MVVKELIESILPSIWPLVFFVCIIATTLRITYLVRGNHRIIFYKEFIHLIFIVYILSLYYLLTNSISDYYGVNLIPLKELFNYRFGSYQFYRNIITGILMFVPLGYFISHYLNSKKCSTNIVTTLIICACTYGMQYYIGHVFNIDNIILNVIGAFLGYLIYVALSTVVEKLPKFMKSDTFINIFLIILIILIVFFSFNINIFSYL